jgi:hypothetical protein
VLKSQAMTMRRSWKQRLVTGASVAALLATAGICSAADQKMSQKADQKSDAAATAPSADSSLYLKVQLADRIKLSKLKPGDVVEGSLARDVYSADRELFRARSQVRLTVDHLEKRRRPRNDHWPWVINIFTPRHESYPAFKTATIAGTASDTSLQVSMISVSRRREVHAQSKKDKSKPQSGDDQGAVAVSKSNGKKPALPTMILEATGFVNASSTPNYKKADNENAPTEAAPLHPGTVPSGTQCKILLLSDVSASRSKPGDVVRARLLEPVVLNEAVALPAGSVFEGKVLKQTPPRWLSRAGSLYLTFTDLTLPDGSHFSIAASLAGAELDQASHTRMDAEGRLHGERPGKAWMLINLGVTAGVAKEVDDGVQLIIEAIISTATDASTAGTSRIIASCASGLYMVTRHGRDVVLPRFTEMDISLDRPVTLGQASLNQTALDQAAPSQAAPNPPSPPTSGAVGGGK